MLRPIMTFIHPAAADCHSWVIRSQECTDAHFAVAHRKLLQWPSATGKSLKRLKAGLLAFIDFCEGPSTHASGGAKPGGSDPADGGARAPAAVRFRRQSYMRQLGVADVVLSLISSSSSSELYKDVTKVPRERTR
jgi:hypothetical protein